MTGPNQIVSWTPNMLRVVFDTIDQESAKNENSLFITDIAAAFQEVRKRLTAKNGDDEGADHITDAKISGKLTREVKKAGLPANRIASLYTQGSSILDLSAIQEGTYTETEISRNATDRENTVNRQPGPSKPSRPKRHGTVEPTNDDRNSTGKRKSLEAGDEHSGDQESSDRQGSLKRQRTSKQSLVEGAEGVASPRNSQTALDTGSNPSSAESSARPGNTNTAGIVVQKTFVCEYCNKDFDQRYNLTKHKLEHEQLHLFTDKYRCDDLNCGAHFTTQLGLDAHKELHRLDDAPLQQATQIDNDEHSTSVSPDPAETDSLAFGEQDIVRWMGRGQTAHCLDVKRIKDDLNRMQYWINGHVNHLLKDLGIDKRTPPKFDIDNYEQLLIDFLVELYGNRAQSARTMQMCVAKDGDILTIKELVVSIIAVAVMHWALRPLPQGDIHGLFETYTGVVSDKSTALQDSIMERACKQYLDEEIRERIPQAANEMALDLIHLLRHVLSPLRNFTLGGKAGSVFSSNREARQNGLYAGSTSASHSWPYRRTPEEIFIEGVAKDVFQLALKLRVDMEHAGHAEYWFDFSNEGESLDVTEQIVKNPRSNREIDGYDLRREAGWSEDAIDERDRSPPRRIKIGITPRVRARYQRKRDRPLEEEMIVICKAQVHLWPIAENEKQQDPTGPS